MRFFRKRADPPPAPPVEAGAPREGPVGFGYKSAWLAVRSDAPEEVADALGLDAVRAAPWSEGVDPPPDSIFVTPPVDGWTLAVLGRKLAEDDGGGALDFAALSRRFGEVQKFATHRVVEYHEWQRWVGGSLVRRYCYIGESGEVTMDEGERAEAELGIAGATDLDDGDVEWADEETVMAVAAEWSVDPTMLDERDDLPPEGLLGRRR